jgi:cytochrome P450
VVRGIYRVYFHPLSRFPGPRVSAFTRIPHITAIAAGQLPRYVAELHEQYGEVVRISPDELSFTNPKAWRDIYGHGSKEGPGAAPPKNWGRQGRSVNGAKSIITQSDNAEHARIRKIFAPAFSDRALVQQAPLFTKYADQLVSNLRESVKKNVAVDLVRMYNFTTFDVMADLTFGECLHLLDNAEYDPWVKVIFANIKRGAQLNIIYGYYPMAGRILSKLLHKKLAKAQLEHHNFTVERVTKRLEKGRASEGVDLWDLVLQQEEKGKAGLTRPDMDINGNLFMIAGTETTATLLSGLTYLLLSNPETMAKLVAEIRTAFTSSDGITMEVTAGLPYLNACIKEAFRQYPPVPIGLPHLTPAVGSTVCGHFVPPNVSRAPYYLTRMRVSKDLTLLADERRGHSRGHVLVPRQLQIPRILRPRALARRPAFRRR